MKKGLSVLLALVMMLGVLTAAPVGMSAAVKNHGGAVFIGS